MDLVSVHPIFNLYNIQWPIYTAGPAAASEFVFEEPGRPGEALDSLVSAGVIVSGWHGSALGPLARRDVRAGALVEDSVLMNDVPFVPGAVVRRAILDKNVIVRSRLFNSASTPDRRQRFTVSARGVVVVGKGGEVAR